MSIMFGVINPEGYAVEERQLLQMAHATDRWAPDGTFVQARGQIGMGFQPYHTHARSHLEGQPVIDELGNMVTLDGRFDNHRKLLERLEIADPDTSDAAIALAAFTHWGEKCFSEFIGDWALALWSYEDRSLYLARDHAGTRTLYSEFVDGTLLWRTSFETFFVAGPARELHETYAARYLSCRPIEDLTPYRGITAITPSHYLKFNEEKITMRSHWQWIVKKTIKYRTDEEYEE